jgi:tetratricopeptide (TPR) repeat protein
VLRGKTMSADWFRNAVWNDSIERAFHEKLRRARRKGQYLRIQAHTLACSYPEVALKLLDRYFELLDDLDHAQAHVDRATALLALGRVADAITAYEAALARETVFPNLQTQAYLDLPYLVATRGVREQYPRALELLQIHESRLTFPVDYFCWHAARALIAAATHETGVANVHAERALEAAAREHSGFRHHPSVGLVTAQYDEVIRKLEALVS